MEEGPHPTLRVSTGPGDEGGVDSGNDSDLNQSAQSGEAGDSKGAVKRRLVGEGVARLWLGCVCPECWVCCQAEGRSRARAALAPRLRPLTTLLPSSRAAVHWRCK
jgi:hypothetical protein